MAKFISDSVYILYNLSSLDSMKNTTFSIAT